MATAEIASLEEGTELSNKKTNNKTNTPTLQEQNDAEEGGGAVSGVEEGYTSFSRLKSAERKAFDPT
eukprot:3192186-Ditylum_brightwellii.AAC.1